MTSAMTPTRSMPTPSMSRRRGCRSPITVRLPKFSYLARSRHYGVFEGPTAFSYNKKRPKAKRLRSQSRVQLVARGWRTCQLQLAGGSADAWLRHPFSIPTHPKSARPPWAPRRISCQFVAAARLPDHGRVGGVFLRPARDCGSDDGADDQRRAFRRFGQAVDLPGARRRRRDAGDRRQGARVKETAGPFR